MKDGSECPAERPRHLDNRNSIRVGKTSVNLLELLYPAPISKRFLIRDGKPLGPHQFPLLFCGPEESESKPLVGR